MTDPMAGYIARAIMNAERQQAGRGAELYTAYFVTINTWAKYKPEVDVILLTEGFGQCIVTV